MSASTVSRPPVRQFGLPIGRRSPLSLRLIYGTYYLFIFSIPFETVDLGLARGSISLTKLIGFALILVVWPRPKLCFRKPPKAFWCFATNLGVVTVLGIVQPRLVLREVLSQVLMSAQLVMIFWVAWSLMQDEGVVARTLIAFGSACTTLGILQVLGITETHEYASRTSAMGFNPNELALLLSLGLLTLLGVAYGRREGNTKRRLLALIGLGFIGAVIVSLGSRGGSLSLGLGLVGLLFRRTGFPKKLALVLGGVAMVGLLVIATLSSQPVRERWENTLRKGDLSGREKIYPRAWEMFLDNPLIGWGPVTHLYELGSRLGVFYRDPHNDYLWIVDESGLVGAIPFFAGLGFCWQAAWAARRKSEGGLPLALLICLCAASFKGSYHFSKFFWVVLAYASASGTTSALRAVVSGQRPRWNPTGPPPTFSSVPAGLPAVAPPSVARSPARSQPVSNRFDDWKTVWDLSEGRDP